jgi:hypothetical protein
MDEILGALKRLKNTKTRSREWKRKTARDPAKRAARAWSRKKYECAKKKVPFDLHPTDFLPPKTCPILGINLKYPDAKCVDAATPTLDRIDPRLGYVKGNIIIISHLANAIKSNATPEQIQKVAKFYMDLYERLGIAGSNTILT